MKRQRKLCLFVLLCGLFLILRPLESRADQNSDAQKAGLALIGAMDGSGETLSAGLGFLRAAGGERPLFLTVSTVAAEDAASYIALMLDGSKVEVSLVKNYKEYGIAIFQAGEPLSGYTPLTTASDAGMFATGAKVTQLGLSSEDGNTRVVTKETSISGKRQINGASFFAMDDSFQFISSGGPVMAADGSAAGIMVQSEDYNLFLPVAFAESLVSGNGGSGSGTAGKSDPGKENGAAGQGQENRSGGAAAEPKSGPESGTVSGERGAAAPSGGMGAAAAVSSGSVPQAVQKQLGNLALVGVMDGNNVAASGLGFLAPANQHGQIFCASSRLFSQETGSYLVINIDGSAGSEASIGLLNDDWGVALLGTQQELPGYSSPQAADSSTLAVGQTVYMAGLETDKGFQILQAEVAGFTAVDGTNFIELSGQFPAGFAGGPLFTESGAVAGALVEKAGMNLALPIDTIMGALTGTAGKAGEGGAAGTAVQDEDSPAVLVAMIPIVALLLIITGVSYISDEFRKDTRGVEEFISPQNGGASSLMSIQGTGGLYAGRSFSIEGSVLMGRDKNRCTIVYPAGSRGISSVHCRVALSGEVVELTDLGSTYGTFLKDGTRLTPNSPYLLHRGEEFYLADVSNGFRVC